jgi:hypothetical protein
VTLLPPGLVLLVWRLRDRSEWRAGRVREHRSPARLGRGDGGRSGNETRISRQSRLLNGDQLK